MSQSRQQSGSSGRTSATRGRGAKSAKAENQKTGKTGVKSASSGKNDGPERPGASGHRFGPDLACSECGILWDVHQREPKPCKTETVSDAFARRPPADFADAPKPGAPEARATGSTPSAESPGTSDAAGETTKND